MAIDIGVADRETNGWFIRTSLVAQRLLERLRVVQHHRPKPGGFIEAEQDETDPEGDEFCDAGATA